MKHTEFCPKVVSAIVLIQAISIHIHAQMLPSSQIIDNFDDDVLTNWVIPAPGCANTYNLTESSEELQVDFGINQPECYDKFYKVLSAPTDFSATPVLSFKMKSQTSTFIKLQVELEDIWGVKTNSTPYIIYNPKLVTIDGNNPNGVYYEYAFDFSGDWNQVWPSAATVDKTQIQRINFYVNGNNPPAGFYTGGTLWFDDFSRRPNNPLPTSGGSFYANGDHVNYSSSSTTHIYRLTDDNGLFQSSTIFYKTAHDWTTNFDAYFKVYVGCYDQTGADGIAFLMMNDATLLNTTGGGGGGQGYGKGQRSYIQYPKSLAVEFDTWDNTGDGITNDVAGASSDDHLAFNTDGYENNLVVGTQVNMGNIEDNTIHLLRINYTAASTTLKVYWDGVLKLSTVYNIANYFNTGSAPYSTTAYWGLSGSTGGSKNEQWFSYNGTSSPPTYTTACGSNLPVKFISFNAFEDNNSVELKWQTSQEVNNDYFEIQRKTSKEGQWEAIGNVDAKGNNGVNEYEFWDNTSLAGTVYYRLRQVDISGTSAFSSAAEVNFSNASGVNIYPNPARENFTIEVLNEGIEEISVCDINGNVVYKKSGFDLSGSKFIIATTGMKDGIYFVKTGTDQTESRSKILIMK